MNESVHDYLARYLEQGIKGGLSSKQVCVFMTSQLPDEARQAAKEWILEKDSLFAVKVI